MPRTGQKWTGLDRTGVELSRIQPHDVHDTLCWRETRGVASGQWTVNSGQWTVPEERRGVHSTLSLNWFVNEDKDRQILSLSLSHTLYLFFVFIPTSNDQSIPHSLHLSCHHNSPGQNTFPALTTPLTFAILLKPQRDIPYSRPFSPLPLLALRLIPSPDEHSCIHGRKDTDLCYAIQPGKMQVSHLINPHTCVSPAYIPNTH